MRCAGFSLRWPPRVAEHRLQAQGPQQLWLTGSRAQAQQLWRTGPVASRHMGSLPDQGSIPCPLHWQADSQPLRHQGSPVRLFLKYFCPLGVCCSPLCLLLGGSSENETPWGYWANHFPAGRAPPPCRFSGEVEESGDDST